MKRCLELQTGEHVVKAKCAHMQLVHPLGVRLVIQRGAIASVGMGLRAGTPRNKVHILRRIDHWLTQAKQVTLLTGEDHLLVYLQLRVQDFYSRNALKCFHQGFRYPEAVAEVVPEDRLTTKQRYDNLHAELLSKTRPGNTPQQVPSPLARVLEALELIVFNKAVSVRLRTSLRSVLFSSDLDARARQVCRAQTGVPGHRVLAHSANVV